MVESKPAPGDLERIRSFVNTHELDPPRESIGSPADLRIWLESMGWATSKTRVTSADVELAIRTREALRGLLLANNGYPLDPAVTADLDAAARAARFSLHFGADAASLHPEAAGTAGAIGALLAIVADAMADGSWNRFKACGSDDCEWAFFDYSRNRSRRWCEMAVCGNREKARTYRERHAGRAETTAKP